MNQDPELLMKSEKSGISWQFLVEWKKHIHLIEKNVFAELICFEMIAKQAQTTDV